MSKMGPFSHFGPQSAKKGARNRLFNRPFGPGRQMTPKMRFWAENAILEAKMGFWVQNGPKVRFGNPKSLFGVHFAPWLKRLMKQRVSWLLFRTFGAKMQKWSHVFTFGHQNGKKGSFCTFGAKSARMTSFSVFGSQSEKKGS